VRAWWAMAAMVAGREGVRIVRTRHGLRGAAARLYRRARGRGGGLMLLVDEDLDSDEAGAAAMEAMACLSARAWTAWAEAMRGRGA